MFNTGRCNAENRCPILESGLVGPLVDDLSDEQQPSVTIHDIPRKKPDLSQTNHLRSAFCALQQHATRPRKQNPSCGEQ